MIKYIINIVRLLKFDNSLSKLKKCDVLLFCSDNDRGISLENKAYAHLLDTFKEDLEKVGLSCISIAHPGSILTNEKAYGSPISINRSYTFVILKKVFYKFGFIKNNPEVTLYQNIFKKAQNKILITIGIGASISTASRLENILHLELLHSVGHHSIPWQWDKKPIKHIPQGVLSLDSVSTKTFSRLSLNSDFIVKEIPHPFLKRFLENDIPDEWKVKKVNTNYRKEILVSLEWIFADKEKYPELYGILENGIFYKELEDVIKETQDEIYWRFRFHPVQLRQKEKYKKQFDTVDILTKRYKNVDWIESTRVPFFSVVRNCDGMITMQSHACYEASYIGVQSLALSPALRNQEKYKNLLNDLEEQGYVIKSEAKLEFILNWVKTVEKKQPNLINFDSNKYDEVIDWIKSKINK
ncbi:hypothetical protein ACNSOL_10260 [Aliarcobacter lanthieri]|uniref:hypothetical protein n=1 Tax=Aliarcobacter lanthieri TaxID=1355374 RepID=UPI003AB0769E